MVALVNQSNASDSPAYTRSELEEDVRTGQICTHAEWTAGCAQPPSMVIPAGHWLLAVLDEADPEQVAAFRIVGIEQCKREWPVVAATAECNGENLTLTFHTSGIGILVHPTREHAS